MNDAEFLTDDEIKAQNAPRKPNAVDEQDLAGLDAEVAARGNALAASLRQSVMANPDEAATTRALAEFTKIPADVVDRNKEEVTAQARVATLQGVLASSPILARQMVDPEFSKLAHDDAENLSLFEKTLRTYLGASVKSGVESLLGTTAKFVDTVQPFTLSEQDAAVLFKDRPEELRDFQLSNPSMFLSRFARSMQQASEATMQNVNPDARAKYGDLKYATTDLNKAAYLSPIKVVGDAIQSLPTTLALAVSMYVTRGTAQRVEAQALASGMTPDLARQAAMHAGAETMAKLGAATEGAAGFGQQAIQTREQADRISDATLATSPEYQRLLASGYSKEAARAALAAVTSDTAGAVAGVADAATNYYGGQFLGKIIGEGGALLKRIAKGFATEATTEAVQSGIEQLGQNAAVQKFLDHHQELLDGVAENVAQGFVVGGVMGGAFTAAAGAKSSADRAQRDADVLKELMGIAGADKLRERNPEEFKNFVQAAAEESGTESVFIDAATFAQAAQDKGLDVAATMPETAAQMEEAIALKADVRIPLGELTSALPGTGLENTLLQHMRMSPAAPSLAEIQDKQFVEETQKAVAKAIGEFEFDTAQKSSSLVVEHQLLAQLTTANRFTKDVNEAYAGLMATFYTVQAARLGVTAEELYVKYPLRIVAENVAGKNAMDQGIYHGPVQAYEYEGRDGEKRHLTRKEQGAIPVEAVAALAGQKGEVRGAHVNHQGPAWEAFKDDIRKNGIQEPILIVKDHNKPATVYEGNHRLDAAIELGLKTIPAEIRYFGNAQKQGLVLPESTYKNVLKQSGDITKTRAFKKWFGKSKVVDDDGRPLRVYHGTTADFTEFDRARGNPESDWGAGFYFSNTPEDVEANYAGEGPDLTQKIELLAERIAQETDRDYKDPEVIAEAKERLAVQHGGATLAVYLSLQNPVVVGGPKAEETFFDYESGFNDATEEQEEEKGKLVDFIVALRNTASRYDDGDLESLVDSILNEAMDYGGIRASQLQELIKADEHFGYYTDENGVLSSHEIARLAFEAIGFDGIIDNTVDDKFGTGRTQGKQMEGMHGGTVHYIAFMPQQIKSAIGNSGKFNPNDANILHQDAPPPFYSELSRQLAALKMNSGSPQAWKDALKGLLSKSVKQAEIDATGIVDWLDMHAEPTAFDKEQGRAVPAPAFKISKDEVMAFLATRGVRVTERILGGKSSFEASFGDWQEDEPDDEFLREVANDLYLDAAKERIARRDEVEVDDLDPSQLLDAEAAALDTARRAHYEDPDRSQHREIEVSANGKTYRFVFSTQGAMDWDLFAPGNQGNELDAAGGEPISVGGAHRRSGPDDAQIETAIRRYLGEKLGIDFGSEGAPFEDYTLPGGENYQVLLLTLPRRESKVGDQYPNSMFAASSDVEDAKFVSSHFDEPNILAHVRTTERTDTEGKRVLFVEEIQSDWAQKGKKEGFATPELDAELKALDAERVKLEEQAEPYAAQGQDSPKELIERWTTVKHRIAAVQRRIYNGVPTAPFVGKTEAWVALAIKRVITYAEQNGFDRVAWTTGEQQADRYSLSKTVSSIRWNPKPSEEGSKVVHIAVIGRHGMDSTIGLDLGKDGVVRDTTSGQGALIGKKLEDVIGKEAAKKIIDADNGKLEGEGLKIGGEGMRAFYDKIVPNVANDVLKKLGGERVGRVAVHGLIASTNANLKLAQEQGAEEVTLVHELDGSYKVVGAETQKIYYEGRSYDDAGRAAQKARLGPLMGQPGFTITREMKDNLALTSHALPLFQPDKWADEMSAALEGATTQGKNARGQISFGDSIRDNATITLLKNADLSTFLHETGHFYLEVMSDIASQPGAPTEIQGDMQRILNWFGVPDLATWQGMTLEQKRPFHEQFARGFESYLFSGKAPNTELQGLFTRFRAWLINVYRNISALNVDVTDEVRQVFDRMLATNDEILQAEAARAYVPLFKTAEEMGATAEEWRSYQELGHAATQEAVDLMQTRSLRDMKWLSNAKSRLIKKLQKEAESKRKVIEREITEEVRATPVYSAIRFLTHGELPEHLGVHEELIGKANKLSLPALKAMYGEEPAAPWRYLNTGKYGHVTAEDGLNPSMVAELFGFTSGDHLVREILASEPEANLISGLTDQRMLERYGDLTSPEAVDAAANEAVHNEARGRFLATEVQALAKAVGQRKVLIPAAKEFAATLIARKKIKDIHPGQYVNAETRAAKSAERAKSLVERATEKRNQLVNHYAARAAYDAKEEIEKSVAYLRRVGESKTVDPTYREQILALLDRFELRSRSNKDAARRESLLAWVEDQRAQGLEPVIDNDLLDEMKRMPYREMPLEEFRGLVDAVRNIEHLGRLKHKLLALADQREFAAVVGEATDAIEKNAKRTIKAPIERTKWTKIKSGVAEFFALHRKFSMMMREMDGHADNGVLWKLFVRPMNRAGDTEAVMREAATKKLQALLSPIVKAGRMTEKRYIPEIKESLTREGRIMVALNMGNAGNLQRLLDGDGWSIDQANAILNTLTKQEMDFVQKVWDFIGEYRNEIGAQQKRITGVAPEWVEPRQVQTIHGEYRGGYIPAKYDTTRSTRSLSDEAAQGVMDMWRAKRGAAKARDSFTKERANKVVNRPLRKDFGVITQHVTEVTHRLAWQEYLMDAQRLLRAPKIDKAIRDHYGPEVLKALRDTIEDIAAGEVGAQNAFETGVNYLRTGATIAGLGWRLTTAMLQPIGLTQSMVRIGTRHVAAGLVEWLGDAAKMESTAKKIFEKSDMMRLRSKTMQREISEIRNVVAGKNSAIEASFFYLITKLQLVADIPTWLGQYHKAVEAGSDEKEAVASADQAVLDAQGGGQIKDLAGIQRGGPMLKLFTNFYSFFNTTYNMTSEAVGRAKGPLGIGFLAVDLLLLYTVPAVLGTLMKAALHSGDDGEDEKKLVRQLIADQLTYLFGTMVGLREVAGALQTAAGVPGDYQGPASVRVFAELAKLGKQVNQGEIDEALLKAANNTAGILFHYPAGQIGATVDGIVTMANGKTQNPGALIVGSNKK